MKAISKVLLLILLAGIAIGQSSEPPLAETRLSVSTLVREDIFAGFLKGDMERFARGEKNIQLLLEQRAASKPDLLAWRGGTRLYRAVLAHEKKQTEEFEKTYKLALEDFAQARALGPNWAGVAAIIGGSYTFFADQLPQEHRAAAWSQAYDSYKVLWKQQAAVVDKMPVHIRGELLGGLAQASYRTGRADEGALYLEKIIELMPNTPYEPVAKKWKSNPETAAKGTITCMTCHDAGRLAPRMAELSK